MGKGGIDLVGLLQCGVIAVQVVKPAVIIPLILPSIIETTYPQGYGRGEFESQLTLSSISLLIVMGQLMMSGRPILCQIEISTEIEPDLFFCARYGAA